MIRNISLSLFFLLCCALLPQTVLGQARDAPGFLDSPIENVDQDFSLWLETLKGEAREKGISEPTIQSALGNVVLVPRVVELDRKQPEFRLTLDQYLSRVVPASRMAKARKKFSENRALLKELESRFGVQGRFLVAFWGIETDFGRVTGGFKVIPALVTLAYDGRRSKFFRKQLFHALQIIDAGHVSAEAMTGSWAGAMGQTQFMPSTFTGFATDHDGDGRNDLWGSRGDALASGANYLAKSGWDDSLTWGREVRLPDGFNDTLGGKKNKRLLSEWQALGVRRLDGTNLPDRALKAALILPEGAGKRAFLTYDNFEVILKWNRSNFFAIAVGTLADAMAGM